MKFRQCDTLPGDAKKDPLTAKSTEQLHSEEEGFPCLKKSQKLSSRGITTHDVDIGRTCEVCTELPDWSRFHS